jgi:replicative DNA helicase
MTEQRNFKKAPTKEKEGLLMAEMMPQAKDLEAAVIGALLLERDAIYQVIEILRPDSFYVTAHGLIYEAIVALFDKAIPADTLTVVEHLARTGKIEEVGGPYVVNQTTTAVTSSANIVAHALIIEQKAIARRVLKVCAKTISELYDRQSDVFAVIDALNEGVAMASETVSLKSGIEMGDIMKRLLKKIEIGRNSGGMTGVPSGIQELDDILGGFQDGNLILIGARTRHGKSAVAAAIMHMLSKIPNPDYNPKDPDSCYSLFPTGLLSMEMQDTEVGARLLSAELKDMGHTIEYTRIFRGLVTDEEHKLLIDATGRLVRRGIYIDDTPALTTTAVKAKALRMIKKYKIRLLWVDFVQLLESPDSKLYSNEAQSISRNMTSLKNMAKALFIPVIALSQVDRLTEKKEAKEPVLADLKGSGGLEEKADVVILLYRPEVNDENPVDPVTGASEKGIIYFNIAKNKQGKTEKLKLPFQVSTNTFVSGDGVLSSKIEQYLYNHPTATKPMF